jgi:hypothetical protein
MEKANNTSVEKLKKVCLKYGDINVSECFVFGLDEKGMDVLGKSVETDMWVQLRFPWDSPISVLKDYELSLNQFLHEKSK